MSDKIGFNDLFDPNFKGDIKAATDQLATGLQASADKLKEIQTIANIISKNPLITAKDVNGFITDLAKGEKAINDHAAQVLRTRQIQAATAAQALKEQNAATKAADDTAKAEARLAKEVDKSTGTINKLKQANSELTKERNKLDLTTKQGQERLLAINKALDANNGFIKANSSALEKQRLEIGNYKEAILEATGVGRLFGGVFGEVGTKLRAVGEILTGVREQLKNHAEVVAANTEATIINTETEELNSAAVEANTIAEEESVVATELETAATEKASLAKKAFNAITSTTGLILLAVAAAAKILYDNFADLTQAERDETAAKKEGAEQAAKSADTRIMSTLEIAKRTHDLYLEEKQLEDLRISKEVEIQKLRTQGAKARLSSEEEGKTTKDRIAALGEYIEKIEEVGKTEEALSFIEIGIAKKRLDIDAIKGDPNNREDKKKLEDARTEFLKIQEEDARELLRATKRRTSLIEKDDEDKRKMLQESQMRRIESIQDSSKREVAIENEKYKESLSNLKLENKKSGIENKNFYAEEQTLLKLHYVKLAEIKAKQDEKVFKIKSDTQDLQNQEDVKIKEREIKELDNDKKTPQLKKFNLEAKLEEKLRDARKKALIEKEKNDEIIANNTIDNTEELNAEIEKLHTKLNIDLLENDLDYESKTANITKKRIEYLRKEFKEELDTILDFNEQLASRKDAITEKQLNNDLDKRQRNILQQQQLAEEGYNNTLAFEKAAAAKDELAKQQLAIKEQKREKAEAFLKLLAAYAEKGDPDQAVTKALVQMAIAGAITGAYYDGTENVGEDLSGNKVHSGKDGYVVAVDGSERIMTGWQNRMVGNLTNDELATLARNYNDGLLPSYITNSDTPNVANNIVNSLMLQEFSEMKGYMRSVEKLLRERPTSSNELNNLGEIVNTKIINGLKRVTTKKNNNNYL